MKIKPSIDECSNIIVGAYSASSFYEKFDKVLYENNGKFADVTFNCSACSNSTYDFRKLFRLK